MRISRASQTLSADAAIADMRSWLDMSRPRHRLDTRRIRTPLDQPKRLLGLMYERVNEREERCLFGFAGGRKLLLFPDHGRVNGGGERVWKLYEVPLSDVDEKM